MMMEVQLRRLGPNSRTIILKPPSNGAIKTWLAGRGTCCQIFTKSKYASRKHFSITFRDGSYYLIDLQSANGTFLNSYKITSEERLNFGNTISVGVPPSFQNVPDSVIYIFEQIGGSETKLSDSENDIVIVEEVTKSVSNEVKNIKVELLPEVENPNCNVNNSNKDSSDVDCIVIDDSIEVVCDNEKTEENVFACQTHKRPRDSSSDESKLEEKPTKILKLCEEEVPDSKTENLESNSPVESEMDDDNNHMNVYNESTQIDEINLEREPDLLNYSQVEDFIELSDSENEEWTIANVKTEVLQEEEGEGEEEEKEEDEEEDEDENDVMFIQQIIKNKESTTVPNFSASCTDLTETDRKWVGRLLKIKQEICSPPEKSNSMEITETDSSEKITDKVSELSEPQVCTDAEVSENQTDILPPLEKSLSNEVSENQTVTLPPLEKSLSNEVSENQTVTLPPLEKSLSNEVSENQTVILPPLEKSLSNEVQASDLPKIPENTILSKQPKKTFPKKSVRFDLVPKIKYFEIPPRVKFTAEEKGNLHFAHILFCICNWNTKWLEECKRVASDKDPPNICDMPLRKIPKKFTSHTDYMSAFTPLMLLNLWHKVKDSWKRFGNSAFKQTISLDFYEDYQAEKLCICECTGVVQNINAHKQLLRNGHLVILYLSTMQNPNSTPAAQKYSKNLSYPVFGFLKSKVYVPFGNQDLHERLAGRCPPNRRDLFLVKLTIVVKKRPDLKIDNRNLIQIMVVHHISTDIKRFTGICFLPRSPLFKAILKPNKTEFTLKSPPKKKDLVFKGSLSIQQKELVSNLSYTCSSTDSFLYSIHGAAGTGKSHVVVALILELLYGNEWKSMPKPKIIYCTSSSAPLDAMVSRLKTCRDAAPSKFSIVRLGPGKDFNLSSLTQNMIQSDTGLKGKSKTEVETKILVESDVICTTCTLTGLSSMIWAFEKRINCRKDQKIVCILDEAMSCKEPDSLLPLFLGVTHFILVGDVYLSEPSFSVEKLHHCGLDISLFSRLFKNYANIPTDLWPISILKTQFRAYPALSKFTASLIYTKKLIHDPSTSKYKINGLPSYLAVVDQTPELSDIEKREGQVVLELVKAIIKIANKRHINIFVITCEPKQTEVIKSFVTRSKYPQVEVNQLLKFQGREADVVLFFYNGSNVMVSHLALSLTRAKSCLIVLASEKLVTNNEWFQKVSDYTKKRNALKYIKPETTPEEFESLISVKSNQRKKTKECEKQKSA